MFLLVGILERDRISPYLVDGLDKSLRLAIVAWRIGPGTGVLEAAQ